MSEISGKEFRKRLKNKNRIDLQMMECLVDCYEDGSILVRVTIDLLRQVRRQIEKGFVIQVDIEGGYASKRKIVHPLTKLSALDELKEWVRLNFPGIEDSVMSDED